MAGYEFEARSNSMFTALSTSIVLEKKKSQIIFRIDNDKASREESKIILPVKSNPLPMHLFSKFDQFELYWNWSLSPSPLQLRT